MAMKFYTDHTLLLKVYSFEGFSNWYKIDRMVNNYLNSDFKKSANITKDRLQYLVTSTG